MIYGLANSDSANGYQTADEIVALLNPTIPLQAAHIQAVRDLVANGCKYSNHDFDVLSAARAAARRTEVASYEQDWVNAMARRTAEAA